MENVFIGGHPMAGSELTGYANSSSAIMKNARYVITPTSKTTNEQLERFKKFINIPWSFVINILLNFT